MMTAARWRTLVALAETGSVRTAARRLTVSESAVSASVTALARELGVPLVRPEGRGIVLTPSGAVYARYAARLLGLLDEAAAAARSALDPERGRLRLAAVTTAGEHLLPGLLAGFREEHGALDLALDVAPSAQVWERLANHRADLVIAGRPPPGADVTVHATARNHLVAVAAPAVATGFDWRTPWLLREDGSGTRTTLDGYLAERGVAPPQLVLGSNGAVVAGAVSGLGATLVSRDAVADLLAAGRLCELDLEGLPLPRPWHAVTGADPLPTALLFVRHLRRAGWRRHRVTPAGR